MLKRITIENYKVFKDVTTIEFRPVTVLLGKNSSGKSSICKLLSVLSFILSDKGKGTFSLLSEDVQLGTMYSDLFHTDILSKMKFEMTFGNRNMMSLNYMMTGGDFILHEYKVSQNGRGFEKVYKNKDEIKDFIGLTRNVDFDNADMIADDFRFSVNYIGPVRELAKRSIYSMTLDVTDTHKVGYRGENTPAILLKSFLSDKQLFERVSGWYFNHMDGQSLTFIRNGEQSGNYSLMVKRGGATVNLADVGEGTNQLLPIITQTYTNNADITIIEQAGLHLHPSAQASVAYRIAEAAVESGRTYLIESHSENIVLGLRNMVAHRKLSPKDVAIYYVDHDGESAIAKLYEIEKDGSMSDWPTGVFAEDFQLLKEINKAAQ